MKRITIDEVNIRQGGWMDIQMSMKGLHEDYFSKLKNKVGETILVNDDIFD